MGRIRIRVLPLAATALLVAGIGFIAVRAVDNLTERGPEAPLQAAQAAAAPEATPDVAPSIELTDAGAPAGSTDDEPHTAHLTVELTGGVFRISGVVPDAATAVNLVASARLTYGPTVTHAIEIDPEATGAPWLSGASRGLSLLPMITEGSIRVEGDHLELSGRAPNEHYLTAFEDAVAAAYGLTDITTNVIVTNLAPPSFNARMKDGILMLSGVMPSDLIREYILGGAVAVYGAESVIDNTTCADDLYMSYWMYTMPDVFRLLAPFSDYELNVENGVTTGSLNDGANFESGSAVLDDTTKGVLTVAVAMLKRDPSLGMLIEGHTDNVGSRAFNQRLSEERADAAITYLVATGIDPARLAAVGYGEDRPVASNRTSDGRALNRRVVFLFEQLERSDT